MNENNEIWLVIPSNPNYECSNLGGVRRLKNGKVLKQQDDDKGYKTVTLYTDNKNYHRRVAKLVWETFNDKPCLETIDHRDRIKTNNNLSNLRCISHRKNSQNRIYPGKNNNVYNLNDDLKIEIITKYRNGEWSTYLIHKLYNIPSNYMCMIAKRGTWDKLLLNE